MPIGIAVANWDSSWIVSEILAILLSDVMGHKVVKTGRPNGFGTLLAVTGCPAGFNNYSECEWPPTYHVALEIWEHQSHQPAFLSVLSEMGEEKAPANLGSVGFQGYEGLFVMQRAYEKCQADFGLHLQYYGNYNLSWFRPDLCTSQMDALNDTDLATCADAVDANYPSTAQLYFDATGDADGVQSVNGAMVLNCLRDRWWIAPSCRADHRRCAAVMAYAGWGVYIMIQQAAAYSMPLAFTNAKDYSRYISLNMQIESTAYYWSPDSTFADVLPLVVELPAYNPGEYRAGIYKTMSSRTAIEKWAIPALKAAEDRSYGLMKNLYVDQSEIQKLVILHKQIAGPSGPDPYETACTWLKDNREIWSAWVPDKTLCPEGRGLVDANGQLVLDRSQAVECATCPAGHTSEKSEGTRVCVQCSQGSFQNTLGTTECKACEAGSVSATAGATACDLCGLGQFADKKGMTACHRCGNGTENHALWTTSQEILGDDNEPTVIQVLGAIGESYCKCKAGSFLWQNRCEVCIEGANCPGNNRLALMPGFFSTEEEPGVIFRCHNEMFCPGGPAGSCAEGRDVGSVACFHCEQGKKELNDGTCKACGAGDYWLLFVIGLGVVIAVVALYQFLIMERGKQPTQFLIVILGLTQMLTLFQMLAVVGRFEINWREPFSSMLVIMDIISFDLEMLNFGCAASMGPVVTFLTRCLFLPMVALITLLVHLLYTLVKREKSWHWNRFLRTLGTISMVFFIILFSLLLAPFQCQEHPSGFWTIRRYGTVFCDGTGEQVHMFIVGGLACSMPITFLAICSWAIMVKLPRSLAQSDAHFLEACSFLIRRFRPGTEMFSVIFLVRNAMVAMTPLIFAKSGRLVTMSLLLYVNIMMVAFFKPWRFMVCNLLDMVLLMGMLVILDMGFVAARDTNENATMLIVMGFMLAMLLAVFATLTYGSYKFVAQKYRKQFRFFLCHQKNAAGSMARLLKIQLERALPGTKTFIDCDDLNDLTRLFSYVGQDTQTFLVLGSPSILTRKWCVGEMVTARANKVDTLILTWPQYNTPDEKFVSQYSKIVPDIHELSKFGIGLSEVEDTLRWLGTVDTLALPDQINEETSVLMANALAKVKTDRRTYREYGTKTESSTCPILVDHNSTEAMACAMVLSAMLKPQLLGTHVSPPTIMRQDAKLGPSTTTSLFLCSENCFKSQNIMTWMLQACKISGCCMIPVISEDGFEIPSESSLNELATNNSMAEEDVGQFILSIRALFQEIAVVFVPQNYSSTHEDLELRAKQAAMRLTAKMQPLAEKMKMIQSDEEDRKAIPHEVSEEEEEAVDGLPQDTDADHGDVVTASHQEPLELRSF